MSTENWLRLADYSNKYRVSISTLRRRIKTGGIQYRFDDGKYLLLDQAMSGAEIERKVSIPGLESRLETFPYGMSDELGPVLSSSKSLLSELKRAYTNILQEKEEQIIQLKEEVSDLKTLVRVLEDDNERLRRINSRIY